tara:strand:- start:910 stop:1398 length:489 start_codon:yes stop_codon:yes gene_type:complete
MYQYSFANVDLILEVPNASGKYQTLNVRGFGTGENLINVMRRAPIATTQFGAYGDMVVSMQRIKAGDLTFPVLMNAPENKILQDYANYFQAQADADGALIYPIQGKLRDNMGRDEATLTNGVILAIPAMSRGQTMNTVTWVITFEQTNFRREDGDDAANFGA